VYPFIVDNKSIPLLELDNLSYFNGVIKTLTTQNMQKVPAHNYQRFPRGEMVLFLQDFIVVSAHLILSCFLKSVMPEENIPAGCS